MTTPFLLIGLLATGLTTTVHAQRVCGDPISPYTIAVLERADAGLQHAKDAQTDDKLSEKRHTELLQTIRTNAQQRIDAQSRRIEQMDLMEKQPCLAIDICNIEEKIRITYESMYEALDRHSPQGIAVLESLAEFLDNRLSVMMRGATDPLYKDDGSDGSGGGWSVRYQFDTDASDPSDTDPLCPFDSRYGPETSVQHGCTDANTAGSVGGELQAHSDLKETFLELREKLAEILKKEAPQPGPIPEPLSGCLEDFAQDGSPPPSTEQQLIIRGAVRGEQRGAFSFVRDWTRTLHDFFYAKRSLAERRNDREEYPEGSAERIVLAGWEGRLFGKRERGPGEFPLRQGGDEAQIVTKAYDGQEIARRALIPLRDTVWLLAKHATSKEEFQSPADETKMHKPLRGFGRDFAWYLRRSCIYRPCSKLLEGTIKFFLKDECFPYTDNQSSEETQKECLKELGVEV